MNGGQAIAFYADAFNATQPLDLPGRHAVEHIDFTAYKRLDGGFVVCQGLFNDRSQSACRDSCSWRRGEHDLRWLIFGDLELLAFDWRRDLQQLSGRT